MNALWRSAAWVLVAATVASPPVSAAAGMEVRFALTPATRVFEFERRATTGAIAVRREVTVTYDEAKGVNVAREVRVPKRVWLQPPDPRANPKLGANSLLVIDPEGAQLLTKLAPKSPAAR